jgi:hypothetical protein
MLTNLLATRRQAFKDQRRVHEIHETQMTNNIRKFTEEISELSTKTPVSLKDIELHNKYEDYLIKSRQANHPHWQVYGPNVIAAFSVFIALILATYPAISYFRPSTPIPSQADTVLKILQDYGTHAASNLQAFRAAGLITLDKDTINKLSVNWQTK